MSQPTIMVAIECRTNFPDELRRELDRQMRIHYFVVKKLHMGGGVPRWILVAEAPVQLLTVLLDSLVQHKAKEEVMKITLGDTAIDSPTLEDLERLKQDVMEQAFAESVQASDGILKNAA